MGRYMHCKETKNHMPFMFTYSQQSDTIFGAFELVFFFLREAPVVPIAILVGKHRLEEKAPDHCC